MPKRSDFPRRDRIARRPDHDDESGSGAQPFPFDDIVRFPSPEDFPQLFQKDGEAPPIEPYEIRDFGSASVHLKPFARKAFDDAKVEHGLARAVSELHDLTESLISDPDFESHAETFQRGVKSISDRVAGELPDGDAADSFRERLSLIAEGKAVELRGMDTRRLVARNRKGLDEALTRYAELAGGAPNRLVSEFSVDQAFSAIDRQINNGVISPDEGRVIEAGFFRQVEDAAARQLIDLDPAHAADNLRDSTIYPLLDAARRAELAALADRRVEQQRLDDETEHLRAERIDAAAKAEAARSFVAGFDAKLRDGQAKATDIGFAEADGDIDRKEADWLIQRLRDDETRRAERARLSEIARSAIAGGGRLDPSNPEHIRAAQVHAADVVRPALVAAQTDDEILHVHARIVEIGFMPRALGRLLGLMWISDDPALGAKAARIILGPDLEPESAPAGTPLLIPSDEAERPDGFLVRESRPGMAEAVALMSAGVPADRAVLMGKDIAAKEQAEAAKVLGIGGHRDEDAVVNGLGDVHDGAKIDVETPSARQQTSGHALIARGIDSEDAAGQAREPMLAEGVVIPAE